MDIVVHGTKGGCAIFTPKKLSGLLDVTSDDARASAIGQQAYGIRFTVDNTIFSKYKIIRDVRGDKRIGFLAFSLFLSHNEKLSGTDIVTLLDKVSDEYCRIYIPDNDDNLNEVIENWDFLNDISKEYEAKLRLVSSDNADKLQSGSKDDAFVYYPYIYKDPQTQKETKFELQEIFDKPFQEEYSDFRQILFVKENLKKGQTESPLNALRHSGNDLTGIDLDNPHYNLREFYGKDKNGVEIKIKNSKNYELRKGDKISRKEKLTIIYSKKYYGDLKIEGSLNNEEVRKYLRVDEDSTKIDVLKDVDLTPEEKVITFKVTKRDGTTISDAEITCKSNYYQPTVTNNQIAFKGEEIGEHYTVSMKKDDTFRGEIQIYPKDLPDNAEVKIEMYEFKNVKITAAIEIGNKVEWVEGFKVRRVGSNTWEKTDMLQFRDKDIEKDCTIQVSKHEGNDNFAGSAKFCPKSDSKVHVTLKKEEQSVENQPNLYTHGQTYRQQEQYAISAGEHGKIAKDSPLYSRDEKGKIVEMYISANRRYKFTGFILDRNKKGKDYAGTLVAQYEKKKFFTLKTIAGSAVVAIIVGFCIWAPYPSSNPEESKPTKEQTSEDTKTTKKTEESSETKTTVLKKKETSKEEPETTLGVSVNDITFNASGESQTITVITNANNYKIVDLPEWCSVTQKNNTLFILNCKENNTINKRNKQIKVKSGEKEVKINISQAKKETNVVVKESKNNEIMLYLDSENLSENKLKEYQNQCKANLQASVKLCLKLWTLDGTDNNSYSWMQKQINNNTTKYSALKSSALKKFLDTMCDKAQTPSPKYWHQIRGNGTKEKTLKNIESQE